MRRTSIRARLALWNVGILAIALIGFGVTVQYTVRTRLARAVEHELLTAAEPFVRAFPRYYPSAPPPPFPFHADTGGHPFVDRPGPGMMVKMLPPGPPRGGPWHEDSPQHRAWDDTFHRFFRIHKTVSVPRLFTPTGDALHVDRFRRNDRPWDLGAVLRAGRGETIYTAVRSEGNPLRVFSAPLRRNGRVEGVVQLVRPISDLEELQVQLTRTLLMLVPVALLAAGLGGAFLTGRALRPVRRISTEAAHLGAHDLSRRLPVEGNDEFSDLAQNFNRMIARLESAFTRLESQYRKQRQFAADASHELRTPLTAIRANTSLALHATRSSDEYRATLTVVDTAASSMARIVDDLLTLARSDAGELNLDHRPVALLDLIEQGVARSSRSADSAPIEIEIDDPTVELMGDDHALTRLIVNLLDNALRHTPSEGFVRVTCRCENGAVSVAIKDSGVGVDPRHLPHLTERFYRVDESRSRAGGGAGLGLSICKSIAEAHGGTLHLESELGQGLTATVTLPLHAGYDVATASESASFSLPAEDKVPSVR